MKRRYKIYTQDDFGELLGIPQCRVSRILNGVEPVSWQLAVVLARLFPGKGIEGWKAATGEEITRLFAQLKYEAELKVKESV